LTSRVRGDYLLGFLRRVGIRSTPQRNKTGHPKSGVARLPRVLRTDLMWNLELLDFVGPGADTATALEDRPVPPLFNRHPEEDIDPDKFDDDDDEELDDEDDEDDEFEEEDDLDDDLEEEEFDDDEEDDLDEEEIDDIDIDEEDDDLDDDDDDDEFDELDDDDEDLDDI
jgi:hypothetical protein